jgi:hypothetical protein
MTFLKKDRWTTSVKYLVDMGEDKVTLYCTRTGGQLKHVSIDALSQKEVLDELLQVLSQPFYLLIEGGELTYCLEDLRAVSWIDFLRLYRVKDWPKDPVPAFWTQELSLRRRERLLRGVFLKESERSCLEPFVNSSCCQGVLSQQEVFLHFYQTCLQRTIMAARGITCVVLVWKERTLCALYTKDALLYVRVLQAGNSWEKSIKEAQSTAYFFSKKRYLFWGGKVHILWGKEEDPEIALKDHLGEKMVLLGTLVFMPQILSWLRGRGKAWIRPFAPQTPSLQSGSLVVEPLPTKRRMRTLPLIFSGFALFEGLWLWAYLSLGSRSEPSCISSKQLPPSKISYLYSHPRSQLKRGNPIKALKALSKTMGQSVRLRQITWSQLADGRQVMKFEVWMHEASLSPLTPESSSAFNQFLAQLGRTFPKSNVTILYGGASLDQKSHTQRTERAYSGSMETDVQDDERTLGVRVIW